METSVDRAIVIGLREMFSTIKNRALEAEREYNEFLDKHPDALLEYKRHGISFSAVLYPELDNKLKKIEGILDSYNDAISKLRAITKDMSGSGSLAPISSVNLPNNASRYLEKIIINCDFAIGIIEGLLISSRITPEERDRLKRTQKKVEAFYECHPLLAEHLKEAIMEIETGHDLAAALIAGKCFVSIEDELIRYFELEDVKVINPNEKKKEQRDQLIKKISKELGLSKEKIEKLHKASILARNFFTHRISSRPSHEESLSLVADTVTFAEYFCRITGNPKED